MPVYFHWDEHDKPIGPTPIKPLLTESRDTKVMNLYRKIMANKEDKLGSGTTSMAFNLGTINNLEKVCYITTELHKHHYFRSYLEIVTLGSLAKLDFNYKRQNKKLYMFEMERLYSIDDLEPPASPELVAKLDVFFKTFKELENEVGLINIIKTNKNFHTFCMKLFQKDATWKPAMKPLITWSVLERKDYPDLFLDLSPNNVLFNSSGEIIYIADPMAYIDSNEMIEELCLANIKSTQEQQDEIIELMTDFIAFHWKNPDMKDFRKNLRSIRDGKSYMPAKERSILRLKVYDL